MTFDATITIGNIMEILAICGGGFLVVVRQGGDLRVIKTDMAHMKSTISTLTNAFDKLGTILTQVAVQDTRISGLEEDKRRLEYRINEMAHGKGFVQDISREYP